MRESLVKRIVEPQQLEELQRRIAEAAYYRAEQRGFQPGREIDDWLAAEADIMRSEQRPN